MKKFIVVLLMALLLAGSAFAYGPQGHGLVGAIADRRLAKNKPVADQIKEILDGLTLEQAATLPDTIKGWDLCQSNPSTNPVKASQRINDELHAFVNANKCDSDRSHHNFHFTDVPVFGGEKYGDGTVGREKIDVVQMIPFCIRVLRGDEPETNDFKITKAVALILLVHYMGDIHQPLHVGAEYFNASKKPFEPTPANKGFADQGGNKLTLFTLSEGKLVNAGKFHGYWDSKTVAKAFGEASPAATAATATKLANTQPAKWKLKGGVDTWSEQLANEILPIAAQAHTRRRRP